MTTALTAEQLINQQLRNLQELEDLLSVERDILQKQNPDALIAIIDKKNNLLQIIQQLDQENSQSLLLKDEIASGNHNETLVLIEDILLRCKDLNHVNGQVIQQSSLAVERMKNSLLENHNRSSMTYDSKGKTRGGLSSLGIKA